MIDRTPMLVRILRKIDWPDMLGDVCWPWTGALSTKRRGQRRPIVREGAKGSRVVNVARVMCELRNGPPPTDKHEAGHTCPDGENSLCVRPSHLVWMTRTENEQHKQAMVRRSRQPSTVAEP